MRRLAALLFLSAFLHASAFAGSKKTLTILYTGDTYGVLGYEGWPGGLARRKQAIDTVRQDNPNLLVLDVGNVIAPFSFSRLDSGQFTVSMLRKMGYDVLNLGSHEFDYGQERLISIQKESKKLQLIASNILLKTSDSPFLEEFLIKDVNGISVGIIGLCDPNVEEETIMGNFAGLKAQDPELTLKRLVPKLRPQVDVLIVLSSIPADKFLKIVEAIKGIDIAISRSTGGETEYAHQSYPTAYDFRYFVTASSSPPSSKSHLRTLFAYASRYGFELGRIDVDLRLRGAAGIEPSVIDLSLEYPEDPEMKTMVDNQIRSIERVHETVMLVNGLKKRLGRPWGKEDFLYLVLKIMKMFSHAEIAVINESAFYKLEYLSEYISERDKLTLMELQHLTWTENHLIRQNMHGHQLKKLLQENSAHPRLRFLGLTAGKDGSVLVNGRPIKDNKVYSIAASNYLAGGAHSWPVLKAGANIKQTFKGKRVILRDLFKDTLIADAATPLSPEEWRKRYRREDVNPYPAQWRFNLESVELNLSDLSTHNNNAFTAVPDARVNAMDQFAVGASLRSWILLDHSLFTWKNELNTAYSRVTLPDDIVNNPIDSLIFNSQINGQAFKIPIGFKYHASPSLRVEYDTEFNPTPGNLTRKFLRFEPGLFTTLGNLFQEVRIGAVSELNLPEKTTRYGMSFYSKFNKPFLKAGSFSQEIQVFYFPRLQTDTPADLLWRGDFHHRINVPIWKGLFISPYLNIFVWRGNQVRETGWNLSTGVSLSFSKLWKL